MRSKGTRMASNPVFLLAVLLGLAGCNETPARAATGQTADAFTEVSRVALDTSVVATIGRINDLLMLSNQVVVADAMTDRILTFTSDGQFKRAAGRRGDGPGEFRTPLALLEDRDGSILVSQLSKRLTRLTPDLDLVGVYDTDASVYIADLTMVGNRVTFFDGSYRKEGENYVLWDGAAGRVASFDPQSEFASVPYWNAAWTTHIAVGSDGIFVADNMVYPIRHYTLAHELVDSVGYPPPSWRQARQPEAAEFAGPGQQGAEDWLRSFTVIDGLYALDDGWLIVTHRDRVNEYDTDDILRADLYRTTPNMSKVWEDIPLPGPIVTAEGSCAWTVVAYPPQPWTIACLQPKGPA